MEEVEQRRKIILESFCADAENINQVLDEKEEKIEKHVLKSLDTFMFGIYKKNMNESNMTPPKNIYPLNALSLINITKNIASTICNDEDTSKVLDTLKKSLKTPDFFENVIKVGINTKYFALKKYVEIFNLFRSYEDPSVKKINLNLLALDTDLECFLIVFNAVENYNYYELSPNFKKKIEGFNERLLQLSGHDFQEYLDFLRADLSDIIVDDFNRLNEHLKSDNFIQEYTGIFNQLFDLVKGTNLFTKTEETFYYNGYFENLLSVVNLCCHNNLKKNGGKYLEYNSIVYNFKPMIITQELIRLLSYKRDVEFAGAKHYKEKTKELLNGLKNVLEKFELLLNSLIINFSNEPINDFLQKKSLEKLNFLYTMFPKIPKIMNDKLIKEVEEKAERIVDQKKAAMAKKANLITLGLMGSGLLGLGYLAWRNKWISFTTETEAKKKGLREASTLVNYAAAASLVATVFGVQKLYDLLHSAILRKIQGNR